MSFSLYDATVPSFLQILESTRNLITKAEDFAASKNLPASDIIQSRIAGDMYPFSFQIASQQVHSAGAIAGVLCGVFTPKFALADNFSGLQNQVSEAIDYLEASNKEDVDGKIGDRVVFKYGDYEMPYLAEQFLMSFSLPNFYFHATTAYDLLRGKGVTIGKMDFLGKLRHL